MDATVVLFMSFLILSYVYWHSLRLLREFCDYSCGGSRWGVFGVSAFCYATVVAVVLLISSGQLFDVDYEFRNKLWEIGRYMLAALLLMLWGFIQFTFLHQSCAEYRARREREEGQRILERDRRAGVNRAVGAVLAIRRELSCSDKCVYGANLVGNVMLGLCFVAAEVLLLDELKDSADRSDWEMFSAEMYVTIFILLMMVIFVPMSAGQFRHEDKQIYTASVIFFLPMLALAYIYESVMCKSTIAKKLSDLFTVAFPLFAMYLASLNYVKKHGANLYKAFLTVTGFGFVLPLSIAYTMYYIDHWKITDTLVLAGMVLFAYLVPIHSCM